LKVAGVVAVAWRQGGGRGGVAALTWAASHH